MTMGGWWGERSGQGGVACRPNVQALIVYHTTEINSDAAVANVVHTKNGVLEVRKTFCRSVCQIVREMLTAYNLQGKRTSKLAVGTGQLQVMDAKLPKGISLERRDHVLC